MFKFIVATSASLLLLTPTITFASVIKTSSDVSVANPNFQPTVQSYPQPPENFNPLTANDQQLEQCGFPPRPNNPKYLSGWETAMKDFKKFITPSYGASIPFSNLSIAGQGSNMSAAVSGTKTLYTPNWSGYMDYNTIGYGFTNVQGTFYAPSASSPTNSYVTDWVGIGGMTISGVHNSPSVLQAGVMEEVVSNGSEYIYPWWEIYPYNNTQPINNLDVSPGDLVYVDISYSPSNNGTFSWYIEDETTGVATGVQSQSGIASYYDGDEAEWVVERPGVAGTLTNLSDFGYIAFFSCSTNNSDNQREGFADAQNYELCKLIMTSNGSSNGTLLAEPGSVDTGDVGFGDYWYYSN